VLAGYLVTAGGACAAAAVVATSAPGTPGTGVSATPVAILSPVAGSAAPDTFFIQAFDVSGVTNLTAAEVESVVYPHTGPGRSKDDVEFARKALQAVYAAKGLGAVLVCG